MVAATWDGTTDQSYSGLTKSDTLALSGVALADIVDITAPFGAPTDPTAPGTFVITSASGATLTFTNTSADAVAALLGDTDAFNTTVGIGTSGSDTITGDLLIAGFGGDDGGTPPLGDALTGSDTAASVIFGGPDAAAADTLSGGAGDNADSIYGGATADDISLTGGGSVAYGRGGGDTITASGVTGSGVTIYGGTGVSDPNDGADSITGSSQGDVIYGNGGNDSINGGGGADTIYGGLGDDAVSVSGAGSVAYGNAGNDTITASGLPASAHSGVTIFGGNGVSDPTDGADSITGSTIAGGDVIYGNGGDDSIAGNGGADTIFGGAGNYLITETEAGGSVVFGNFGSDILDASGVTGATGVTIFGGSGISDPTDGADSITGSSIAGGDVIYGNGGNDIIASGGGADSIFGGAGDDTISVAGAAVKATLLTGGDGADVFVFAGMTGSSGTTLPTVTDFTSNTDLLDFGFGATTPTVAQSHSLADFLAAPPAAGDVIDPALIDQDVKPSIHRHELARSAPGDSRQ